MKNRPCPSSAEPARIGPNAVIQLGEALSARCEDRLAREVYRAAGHSDWIAAPPGEMVSEVEVARLHDALASLAPAGLVDDIMSDAGARTGDYIVANRIPAPARMLLRMLPTPLAARLLVEAIAKHAWTFAGSGAFSFRTGRQLVVEIAANPLAGPPRSKPGCVWHEAVFTRLFRSLVSDRARARETACCAAGDPACRFEIDWSGDAVRAAVPATS